MKSHDMKPKQTCGEWASMVVTCYSNLIDRGIHLKSSIQRHSLGSRVKPLIHGRSAAYVSQEEESQRKEVPKSDFCDFWLVNVFFQGLKGKKKCVPLSNLNDRT